MDQSSARIVIAGSVNMDVSLSVERIPAPGETVLADAIRISGGGKSGNQAIACGRLGGNVALVARVGDDAYGGILRKNMQEAGVDTTGLSIDPEAPTGQAYIAVSKAGENNIIVVPGSNGKLSRAVIDEATPVIRGATYLSTQLEIPLDTVFYLADVCADLGVQFVLNPSPAVWLPPELLAKVSILVLNEHELALLAGEADEETMLKRLLTFGVKQVVLTKGGDGVVFASEGKLEHYVANKVQVVDTTGAGDTFTGGLLVSLSEGRPIQDAIAFAQKAAAIQVTRPGAQDAVPTRGEVDQM